MCIITHKAQYRKLHSFSASIFAIKPFPLGRLALLARSSNAKLFIRTKTISRSLRSIRYIRMDNLSLIHEEQGRYRQSYRLKIGLYHYTMYYRNFHPLNFFS